MFAAQAPISRHDFSYDYHIPYHIARDPLSPREHMLAGWVIVDSGTDAEAAREFQKSLDVEPNYPAGLYFMAIIKEHQKQWGDAVALLEESVQSAGRTPKYLNALGMAYAKAGRRDQALKVLDELRAQAKRSYVEPGFITSLEKQLAGSSPSATQAKASAEAQ